MKTCDWELIEENLYQVGCMSIQFHLDPDKELYEFCPYCGRVIYDKRIAKLEQQWKAK